MRGVAVLIMIQCHTFNSFTRLDLRQASAYTLTQFVGGMAAPLFLFMAGMTTGFQTESLERRGSGHARRWLAALRRGGYILGIAYLFRFTNWVASLPNPNLQELLKVDILNCMGFAVLLFSPAALLESHRRVRFTIVAALAVAAAAPVVSGFDWSSVPATMRDYLVPGPERGRFPFFPCAAYVGFGMAAGQIIKRTAAERTDRLMQWSVLTGFSLILSAQYFGNLPYSIYSHSDFWRNSPALILIRVGVALLMLAAAYLWTYFYGRGWSWLETLGKASLLVYWVHVMLVYGDISRTWKRSLTIPQTALAVVVVTGLMVGFVEFRFRWKVRWKEQWRVATTVAGA